MFSGFFIDILGFFSFLFKFLLIWDYNIITPFSLPLNDNSLWWKSLYFLSLLFCTSIIKSFGFWLPRGFNKTINTFVEIYLLYVCECFTHIYVYAPHALCLPRSQKGGRSPRTRVINSCEPPCRCWAPNHSLMKEQNMLLTTHPLSALKTNNCNELVWVHCNLSHLRKLHAHSIL